MAGTNSAIRCSPGKLPLYFFYNTLNKIVVQVPLDICELENIGVVLRFCPFELNTGQQPSVEEIQSFVQCLEQQLVILRATVQHKETFVKLVNASPVLKLVELPEWAGDYICRLFLFYWLLVEINNQILKY